MCVYAVKEYSNGGKKGRFFLKNAIFKSVYTCHFSYMLGMSVLNIKLHCISLGENTATSSLNPNPNSVEGLNFSVAVYVNTRFMALYLDIQDIF